MFILKLAIIILSIPFLTAITTIDAMRYGSSILICTSENNNNQEVVRYWTLVENIDNENKILNTMNKRSYKLQQCEIFDCSYDPSEMELCKLPIDPPKYKTDIERFKSEKDKEIEEKAKRDAIRR